MFAVVNLINAVAYGVDILLFMFYWLIIIRALISWVGPDPMNPIVQFLERVTEPILAPIRRMLPVMAIDISPILAVVAIMVVKQFLVATIYDLALRIPR
ncbi:MAG: YggT family protein [Candidatus Omnitrophica bacterium]|nr:YggT family protein [Candidatus Omnitrophota bacterium]